MVLAQDLIRQDIEIVYVDNGIVYNSQHIQNTVNYLKHEIYKICNGRTHGKIVYINTNDFLTVVAGMKATWELGAALWLNDTDPKVKLLPYFEKFYNIIDVAINYGENYLADKSQAISMLGFNPSVDVEIFSKPLDRPITQDTVAYYALSSGTTGSPKALPHTHYQTVTISKFIKDYLELDQLSKPLHYKTLHHSSLFNSFALPLFDSCKTHYYSKLQILSKDYTQVDIVNKLCKLISDLGITNFLVPYNWMNCFSDADTVNFDKNLTLCCIKDCDYDKMQDLFNRLNIKQVVNYFGCSEIGTMFIARTTHDTVQNYASQRFQDVTPFIDYELHDNYVKAKWKNKTDWEILRDKITVEGNRLWFHGRSLNFEIENKNINLLDLESLVKNLLNTTNFTLVPDYQQQKLYLAIYDNENVDLSGLNNSIKQQFGPEFYISDCDNFARSDVLIGMKSSLPFLQWYFQNKEHPTQ
jgi:hypothetical protein